MSAADVMRTASAALAPYAEALSDLEKQRIATSNRLGAIQRQAAPWSLVGTAALLETMATIQAAEKDLAKRLDQAMRAHPLADFVEAQPGLGIRSVGRLLGVIGDPYVRWVPTKWVDLEPAKKKKATDEDDDRPKRKVPVEWDLQARTVSQLWAYCGLHVVDGKAPKRRKGEQANWTTAAKTRSYLIAVACVKVNRGPYREVYDITRERYAAAVEAGELTKGHAHNRAMRATSKAALRDLWIAARQWHIDNGSELAPQELRAA